MKRFEGLETRLQVAQTYPPMSERDLVDEAIKFANASPDVDDLWRFLPLSLGVKMPFKSFRRVRKQKRLTPAYGQERDAFRLDLTQIARGDQLSHPEEITEAARGMLLIPDANLEGRQLLVAYRYAPQDLSATLAYVLLLLADPNRGYGRELSQCRLNRCQKFFFSVRPETGRPRTRYCSDEHMKEAHQASASQRVRISRERKKRLKEANQRKR